MDAHNEHTLITAPRTCSKCIACERALASFVTKMEEFVKTRKANIEVVMLIIKGKERKV